MENLVSKHPLFLRSRSLPLVTLLGVALTMTAPSHVLGHEPAHLDGFTQADGGNVFALTLKASPTAQAGARNAPAASGPRDVVILVSTAASQTSDYRAKSLATLRSVLSKLDANDRVKLVAFDLNTAPLTQGFVAPNSAEMAAALKALNQRTPLGSCDLEKALDAAVKSYAGDSKAARAIVYIGDGSSRANVLTTDQLNRIINDLVAQRAPVIAFGVGPRIQEQMLGILASRTGGVVVPELSSVDADAYGTGLARAVHGSVLWPKTGGANAGAAVKWPDGMDVYPKTFPPLRGDRDTVMVGTTTSTTAKQMEIDVEGPAGMETLAWDIPVLKSNANNGYLTTLVDQAKADDGRTLPLIDSASLLNAKQEIEAGGRGLNALARDALSGGNLAGADKLAAAALRRNPKDPDALAIQDAIAKNPGGAPAGGAAAPAAAVAKAGGSNPVVAAPGGGGQGDLNLQGDVNLQGDKGGVPPPDGAAAAQEIGQANALEEQWQKDVQNTINQARGLVTVDPGKAATMIQQKTNDLTAESQLRPEMRDRLMGMLRTAAREIKHRGEEFTHREQERIQQEMAKREMEMANESLAQDQRKVKQLMERYDSLMAEGRHRLAEESAAFEA